MNNLLYLYKDIFKDESLWKYYASMHLKNLFNSARASKSFIKEFIEAAKKDRKSPLYENINNLKKERINHIVLVQRKLDKCLSIHVNIRQPVLWFLT